MTKTTSKEEQEVAVTPTYKTKSAVAGTYNFTHETVTKITVPDQNRTYKMSYLLNPNASYVGMKVDMSEYSDEGMNGESIIVMDKGNAYSYFSLTLLPLSLSLFLFNLCQRLFFFKVRKKEKRIDVDYMKFCNKKKKYV